MLMNDLKVNSNEKLNTVAVEAKTKWYDSLRYPIIVAPNHTILLLL